MAELLRAAIPAELPRHERVKSWWTVKTDFKRRCQKIGDFWLPESNENETKVRVFGTAVLSIEYRDYQISQAGGATGASPHSEALAATVAGEF